MTLVPEERTPETDEALRLIGVIAVESARLEWGLAGLLSMTTLERDHVAALDVPHDRAAKEIVRAFRTRPSWLGDGATNDLIRWTQNATKLLKRRGDLMHSTWITGENPGVGPQSSHLKSGRQEPVDVASLDSFATEVTGHVHGSPPLCGSSP